MLCKSLIKETSVLHFSTKKGTYKPYIDNLTNSKIKFWSPHCQYLSHPSKLNIHFSTFLHAFFIMFQSHVILSPPPTLSPLKNILCEIYFDKHFYKVGGGWVYIYWLYKTYFDFLSSNSLFHRAIFRMTMFSMGACFHV